MSEGKRGQLRIVLLLLSAALLLGAIGTLLVSRRSLSDSLSRFDKAKVEFSDAQAGLAFACGYLAGQRAIITRAGLSVPPPVDPPGCAERRAVADRNGFNAP